jgi:hypothetical protein
MMPGYMFCRSRYLYYKILTQCSTTNGKHTSVSPTLLSSGNCSRSRGRYLTAFSVSSRPSIRPLITSNGATTFSTDHDLTITSIHGEGND